MLLSQSQRSVPVRTSKERFISAGKGTYNVFRTRVFYTKQLKRDHPNVRISIEITLFSCHLVLCRLWGHEQYHNFQIPSHRKFEIVQHHFRSNTIFERIYISLIFDFFKRCLYSVNIRVSMKQFLQVTSRLRRPLCLS